MAEADETNTLVSLLSLGSSFAKQRLEGWYKSSTALDEFPNKLSALNAKLELWNRLLKRFGESEDELILTTVAAIEDASKWVEAEEDRLQMIQSTCCVKKLSKAVFPDKLTSSFQTVVDAIDAVPLTMTAKEEKREALERARQRRIDSIVPLPFAPESKYVPLKGSILELQKALEVEDEYQVVTLYGPPGMGKSLMAQHLALHYQEERTKLSVPSQSSIRESKVFFPDGVFYLDCGPDADSRAKHLELLHNLGSRPEQIEIGPGQDAQIQSDYDIHNRLCTRLSGQSVLIILDDVSNEELVQQLLVPEKAVKYVITSQKRGVWEDALHVKIQAPSLEEGRIILANYVGGQAPTDEVAAQLQALADEVIKAADFNPLVLANWGLALKGERSTDPEEWKAAMEELFDVVDDEEDSFSGPIGFGRLMYPRIAASSTMMAIDVVPTEAQSLLLLATLFSGPSIPDQALKIFYESVHGGRRRAYLKWRTHLEDRSFIQVQTHSVPWRGVPIRTWSINRLRQHFIRKVKKEAVSVWVKSILYDNKHNDTDLVIALSAMYGVEELRAGAAKKLGMDIKQNVDVWKCVEPFVWLLDNEGVEKWEQQCFDFAKEVIFKFIHKGRLAQKELLGLLLLPETSSAACWALERMAWKWSTITLWGALSDHPQKNLFKWTIRNKEAVAVFKGVVEILRKDVYASSHRMAANALVAFAWASHDINLPVASNAFGELVALLAKTDNAIAQEAGARALGRLAYLKGRNSQDVTTVGEYAGVVEGLVRLLVKDTNTSVQAAAAEALYFLASDRSCAVRLKGTRGALQKFSDLLGKDNNPDVQQFAVLTLYNLSCHRKEIEPARYVKWGVESLQEKDDVMIPSFVRSCTAKGQAHVQENHQTIRSIASFPGMLRGLVGLLQSHVRPVVQMLAASTLKRLAEVEENRRVVAKFPGALEGFSRMLNMEDSDSPGLATIAQAEAAEALMVLAEVDGSIKQVPGVVDGLKRLLAEAVHPYVQERAVGCFTIIDPIRANQVVLHSCVAYQARAVANIHMGLFHEALSDLVKLQDLEPGNPHPFHELRFVKAMLGDYNGALAIADRAIQKQPRSHFHWAERGVLKRMMGDNEGALADLDKALWLKGDVHEYLKQRGYVRFFLGDETGARSDAMTAMNSKPGSSDDKFSLTELSVKYLGYAL